MPVRSALAPLVLALACRVPAAGQDALAEEISPGKQKESLKKHPRLREERRERKAVRPEGRGPR